jgi:hypothetical protein
MTLLIRPAEMLLLAFAIFLLSCGDIRENNIIHNEDQKTIQLTAQNGDLVLLIDYEGKCVIRELYIKKNNTLSSEFIYTGVTIGEEELSTNKLSTPPLIHIKKNQVTIGNIIYGKDSCSISETWVFDIQNEGISWTLDRVSNRTLLAEEMAFPKWNFKNMNTWKGGILDNGGMVWCKYLKNPMDSYGVHTGGIRFWEDSTGTGLSIKPEPNEKMLEIATRFSHGGNGAFSTTHYVTREPLLQRHHLNRFVEGKETVFAPFSMEKNISITYTISSFDYFETDNPGKLPGINEAAVRELMNTTARYGVVDNNIVGGNGWLTNWKCLHEPFFAQIATALNDSNYTRNLQNTLDQERDLAILPDGRVLSRWHNEPGDEIPGTYNAQTGYYEAMWGYTIDSQTGYLLNVTELFDLTADLNWLQSHKESCERALNWLIRRDENGNGLYEMMNRTIKEEKCSDWLDIVWAGYENAFVNAQMYAALKNWSYCERLLNDTVKAAYYEQLASKLKAAFNLPVEQGGFWLASKKQYIYWRDADNSIHGDNLVTPVNFAAIGYGLCEDSSRIREILEQIESRTEQENLMHWPLCFDSFKREEVSHRNWPFPTYENGDIFPTWGYLGIRSYIKYDKSLALKYVRKLLDQYEMDGLSSQRYDRKTGKGVGSDILSGICTGITALYTDVYGIQPKWNRLVIAPNLEASQNGTSLRYLLRDSAYVIDLSENRYKVSTSAYSVTSTNSFGISGEQGRVCFTPLLQEKQAIVIRWNNSKPVSFSIEQVSNNSYNIKVDQTGEYRFLVTGLSEEMQLEIKGGNRTAKLTSVKDGAVEAEIKLDAEEIITISSIKKYK